MLTLPPARSREGTDGLRVLADVADDNDHVFAGIGNSLTVVEIKSAQELSTWRDLLDDLEFSLAASDGVWLRGSFGLLRFEVRIPRGTPAFTAYLDRGWGLAAAAANNTTGVASA